MKGLKLLFSACTAVCAAALMGCTPATNDNGAAVPTTSVPTGPLSTAPLPTQETKPVFANQITGDVSSDPKRRVLHLDMFQLILPLGTISRSEEFWKHVDEDRVDVGTYDLLRKNGWRLGIAPADEWTYFKDILDAYPALTSKSSLSAGLNGGGTMEVPMKHSVEYQNIFYFNDRGPLVGFTFEQCDNLLSVGLHNVVRKPGEARVTVCPTVRGIRKRYEVSNTETGREIRYTHPQRLYDLNIQADVPVGHVLVIAPSPQVKWKTSLGATFLVQEGAAEQLEQVMFFVPHATDVDEGATTIIPAK